MQLPSPVLTGDFSVSDLVREAAFRSIEVSYLVDGSSQFDLPTMSGMIIAEEVQPGLLMSGFDLLYTSDLRLGADVERSIMCSILLEGDGEPLEVEGYPPIPPVAGRVDIVGFGERRTCVRPWFSGQSARVFGISLTSVFFERFGSLIRDDGLNALQRFMEPGVRAERLPWSQPVIDLAEATMSGAYGGSLRALFRESQALRFTVEIATLLEQERRVVGRIGRRAYDRACEARERLDRTLTEPPKVLDLARELGVNVATLQANFKATFGSTVFGYVRSRRLDMARVLIREHGLGVAEAGYRVGFTNAAAFTAAYRRHFGHPPSQDTDA